MTRTANQIAKMTVINLPQFGGDGIHIIADDGKVEVDGALSVRATIPVCRYAFTNASDDGPTKQLTVKVGSGQGDSLLLKIGVTPREGPNDPCPSPEELAKQPSVHRDITFTIEKSTLIARLLEPDGDTKVLFKHKI